METKTVAKDDEMALLREKVKELETRLEGSADWPSHTTEPVVLDFGKVSRKRLKSLKKGKGKLLAEVAAAIVEVRGQMPEIEPNTLAIPIVLLYKKKPRSSKRFFGL